MKKVIVDLSLNKTAISGEFVVVWNIPTRNKQTQGHFWTQDLELFYAVSNRNNPKELLLVSSGFPHLPAPPILAKGGFIFTSMDIPEMFV